MSKNYRIKEFCNYSYYNPVRPSTRMDGRSKYLDLEYSLKIISPELNLKDKVNLNYELIDELINKLKISNNFYNSLLTKTQKLLINVKKIIKKKKKKIEEE